MTTRITYEDKDAITWPARKAALDELRAVEACAAFEQISAPKDGSASDKIRLFPVGGYHNTAMIAHVYDLDVFGPNDTTILDAGIVKFGAMEIKPCRAFKPETYHGLRIAPITNRRRWNVTARTVDPVIIDTPDTTATVLPYDVAQLGPDPLAGYEKYSKANWDGYEALPITADTIDATRYFLEILPSTLGAPYISPGADGTIGLEWIFKDERSLRKLFLDVGPSWTWEGYWRRGSGERQTLPPKPIDVKTEAELFELFLTLSE